MKNNINIKNKIIKKLITFLKKNSLYVSILGLCCQITGILLPAWSIEQKIVFFFGTSILGLWAMLVKQHMFSSMQIVAFLGVIVWFFPDLPLLAVITLVSGALIFALWYLYKTNYYKHDKFAILWIVSLFSLALWFATNPLDYPILFNTFFLGGWAIIAVYSALEFFLLKIKVASIFMILNILFIIKPLIYLIKMNYL